MNAYFYRIYTRVSNYLDWISENMYSNSNTSSYSTTTTSNSNQINRVNSLIPHSLVIVFTLLLNSWFKCMRVSIKNIIRPSRGQPRHRKDSNQCIKLMQSFAFFGVVLIYNQIKNTSFIFKKFCFQIQVLLVISHFFWQESIIESIS